LTVSLSCIASFAHCAIIHGFRNASAFILSILGTVSLCEIYGLRTSRLFGEYRFEPGRMGPMLTAELPLVIPFAWYCTLYPCSLCAAVILRFPPGKNSGFAATIWIVVSSAFATASDVVSDPIMSSPGGHMKWKYASMENMPRMLTLTGDFTWNPAGSADMFMLGVPLQNFLGWAVTSGLGFSLVRLFCGETICTFQPGKRSLRFAFLDTSLVVVLFGTGIFYAAHSNHPPVSRMLAIFLVVLPSFLALCPLLMLLFARFPRQTVHRE